MGRQGRISKQLLYNLTETRGYCKLKRKALDRTVRRTGFGRGYGPVVRQTVYTAVVSTVRPPLGSRRSCHIPLLKTLTLTGIQIYIWDSI
jgi:hypothetical protein